MGMAAGRRGARPAADGAVLNRRALLVAWNAVAPVAHSAATAKASAFDLQQRATHARKDVEKVRRCRAEGSERTEAATPPQHRWVVRDTHRRLRTMMQ